uniref:DDE Tnp4 domain-containing protein n=1 Tax=Astyanax mexicanus TaxID=7994 RepID=A0A3B1KB30_ASTMX
ALTWQVLCIATTILYLERAKPLEKYTTEERFREHTVSAYSFFNCITRRSHSLSVEEQVLIALRFYASGTFYQVVGDNVGVDKSTVSNVAKAVSIALAIIDCTHVHIQAPHERDWEYINRKGRYRINIQLVGDADLIITNCVVKWPGSVYDARILRESALYRELQTNRPDGIILGDSAYPLLPWLMTPFLAATTPAQARFNTAHCKTRCAIQRLNGVLKRRFACLNYLRVEPQGACNIILACIVLHNIATRHNVPLCEVYDAPGPVEEPDQPLVFCRNEGLTGHVNC